MTYPARAGSPTGLCSLLGTPAAGSGNPLEDASAIFQNAIEKPLRHEEFPWEFAPGHAERLALAFGEARLRRPEDPLAPELQVVLAHLLKRASPPNDAGIATIHVPKNTDELIGRALEQHLRRALDQAFPYDLGSAARPARTRALLVLRELADIHGRRDGGQAVDLLAEALGEQGHEVLEKLSTPQTRLVLRRGQGDTQVYVLAHDRLAEVLIDVVDEGGWAELDIDEQLLGLRRFVALQTHLLTSGDPRQATSVSEDQFKIIEKNQEVLLWSEAHRSWWQACREQRRAERRRRWLRRAVGGVLVLGIGLVAWFLADQRARYTAELESVVTGEPETAFAALDRLTREPGFNHEEILDRLRQRDDPYDIFEKGLAGVESSRRAEALVRIAEAALPILDDSPEDPVLIASLVWALDFFARDLEVADRAADLRDRALTPVRRLRPPPPLPGPADPSWVTVPAGTFWMGAASGEGRNAPDMQNELPRHQATISAFRFMTHEVTNAEYRRFIPDKKGVDERPATRMNWFEAYTYAAWLGGRLPTEAEWEYAARAGCGYAYCKRDGSEADLSEVAWWVANSANPETGESSPQRVKQLEPNPLGLWDIYGNVWEWTANWAAPYPGVPVTDPTGPTYDPSEYRTARSGSSVQPRAWVSASGRRWDTPRRRSRGYGLRVLLPLGSPNPLNGDSTDEESSP